MWANHTSRLWLCWAAVLLPAPPPWGIRSTQGTEHCPPVMNRSFAAWVAIWSIASPLKSTNMISATGRMPTSAAPVAAPTIVFSEIGVLRTRSGPNSSNSVRVTPNAPPCFAMSSPSRNTDGSRRISSRRASRIASW